MSTYASGCRPSLLSSLSQSCAHPDTHSIACLRRHCNGQALYAAAASSLQGRSCRLQTCSHVAMALVMVHAAVHCSLAFPHWLVKKGEGLQHTGRLRGGMALQLACSSTRAVLLAARGMHACARLQRGSRMRCSVSQRYIAPSFAPSFDHVRATKSAKRVPTFWLDAAVHE